MSVLVWATLLAVVGVALFNVFWNWMWGMQDDQVDAYRYAMEAANFRAPTEREVQATREVVTFTRDTNPNVQRWVDAYCNSPEGRRAVADIVMRMMGNIDATIAEQAFGGGDPNSGIDPVIRRQYERGMTAREWENAYQQQPAPQTDVLTADTMRRAMRELRDRDGQYAAEQQRAYMTAWDTAYRDQPPFVPDPEALTRVRSEQAKKEEEARQAKERASGLLKEKLTSEQWSDWKKTRSFVVTSQSGKQYRIGDDRSFNVTLIDSPVRQTFCAIPTDSYTFPIEDQVLAQKMWLEIDEQKFLDTANWSPPRPQTREEQFRAQQNRNIMFRPFNDHTIAGFIDRLYPWQNTPQQTEPQGQPNRQIRRAMAPVCREMGCTFAVTEGVHFFGRHIVHTMSDGTVREMDLHRTAMTERQDTADLHGSFETLARNAHGLVR